ncbi:MAG: recombinase family protein, partial [Kutzneria sp.]|nr:recombinase family protein [Kutzneria sp.]
DNDISAYSGRKRPDYLRMLEDLTAGVAKAVTVWHTDRLHRSVRELLDYIVISEQHDLLTHSVRSGELNLSTPTGRAIAITQTAWARQESEHKADRIRAARLQAAQAGRWQGGARPFGFEADGETIRPDEAAEIARAIESIVAGASLRSALREVNARGFRTTFGKAEWDPVSFKHMLLRPRNAGLMVYRGEILGKARWPAIVPEQTWRALVSILNDPSRRTTTGNRVRWLGSGLYVCGVCEWPEIRVSTAGGKRKPAYRCMARERKHGVGSPQVHVVRDAVLLDNFVERVLVERLSRPDAADLLTAPADTVDTAEKHAEATAVRQQLDVLDDDLDEGRITRVRWVRRNERLKARLAEIENDLATAAMVDPLVGVIGASDVAAVWFGTKEDRSDGLDLGRRRAILDSMATVTVLQAPRGPMTGKVYFAPRSVRIEPKR